MRLKTFAAAFLLLSSGANAQTIAIVHAKAWTLLGDAAIDDATIVITDGKIISVTAGAVAPAGARVIDAGGKPVTPGLMNPVTRLGLIEVSSATETIDHAAKAGAPGAGFDVQYAINANSTLIDLARADGVTRALAQPSASNTPPFAGSASLLHLFDGGDIVERARVAVFVTIGNRSASSTVGSRSAQWQLLRVALDSAKTASPVIVPASDAKAPSTNAALVADAKAPSTNAAGIADAKALSTNPERTSDGKAPGVNAARTPDAVALEAVLKGKSPLAITTNRESDLRQAIKLASDYNIRVVIIGGAEAWRVADELAAAKIAVVVDPMSNLPASFDELGARLDNPALLRKAGVTVAMSLDGVQSYNAGLSIREGAGLAVANGMSYADGLRSIITVPAEIWGIADHFGTLAPERDADVVIWDGDPLEPSSAPTTVLIQGREVSLITRQTELRDRYMPTIKSLK
ncbi:amidohydrolase family protein [Steroidobacter sp.]|uniref:amidohydrolase family protein n=1 Tax=Steroidobacter sp. TaxID=1978227 RepID=UPI001A3C6E84|nr:amidohydrolase family protein [Steroidobacter sp.]MBL8269915.1 amidohydrolase family protein [Steroidobacter sp.]